MDTEEQIYGLVAAAQAQQKAAERLQGAAAEAMGKALADLQAERQELKSTVNRAVQQALAEQARFIDWNAAATAALVSACVWMGVTGIFYALMP